MFLEQKLIIWPFGSFNSLSTIAAEQGRIVAVVTQYRKKYYQNARAIANKPEI